MLLTIRLELIHRHHGEVIPAEDFVIAADYMSQVGASHRWFNKVGELKALPPATYITETSTPGAVFSKLDELMARLNRQVRATISETDEVSNVHFFNLTNASNPPSSRVLNLSVPGTFPSTPKYDALAALIQATLNSQGLR